jgi:AbrB family looped-hinge helix DNA binding protein
VKTTVSSKGQIVLPAEIRQLDGIEAGQEFEVERLDRGDYRLTRARASAGVVDWLLACPVKGYFVLSEPTKPFRPLGSSRGCGPTRPTSSSIR